MSVFLYTPSARSTRMHRRTFVALASTVVGALVVGCAASAPASPTAAAAAVPTGAAAAPTATAALAATAATVAPQPAPAAAGPTIVKMGDDYKFTPASITIPKGTTVEWQGTGTQPHTATADATKAMDKKHVVLPAGAEPFDSGVINVGASWKHTFTIAGEYSYICIPHEAMGMIGKITVT